MTTRPVPRPRADFRLFQPIQTRWSDNDQYGHVNNVVYYAYFDTAVNAFLIERAGLDTAGGAWMGLVVDTGCSFFRPASYPELLETGLATAEIGRSSVRYAIGVFRPGEAETLAHGHFVHVYVDRATGRPQPLPETLRRALALLGP